MIKCHCGKSLDVERTDYISMKENGWGRVSTFNGKLLPVCPACYKELRECATRIYQITGNPYVAISDLIDREKEWWE